MRLMLKNIFLILLFSNLLQGQLVEDFSDGNLNSNPTWLGDVNDYTVVDGMCRLNALDAGTSSIFTAVDFPDSLQWDFYFEINTSPSSGNFSRVYLGVDDLDLNSASGLFLQLGESGSDDAISLFQMDQGSMSLLAKGTMGAIASRPDVNVRVVLDASGFLRLFAGYDSSTSLAIEMETVVDFDPSQAQYFGLYNTYTGSNVMNYAYDDIRIKAFEPDITPPTLTEVTVVSPSELQLTFDENIALDMLDVGQFSIVPQATIASISSIDDPSNQLVVLLEEPLQSGPEYTISMTNISDLEDNVADELTQSFLVAVAPASGDIVVNEIMFNPIGSGEDYVEVLSVSDKILQLQGMVLLNTGNDRQAIVEGNIILRNGDIAAFTEDKEDIVNRYPLGGAPMFIYENDIPDFNNGDGNITLLVNGVTIDSFDYDEDYHFNLIDDVEGVSLERINPLGPSNNPDNYQSAAATVGYGTPGRMNSNLIVTNPGDKAFTIPNETFSPNLDGDDDILAIQYTMEKPGFVANLKVYDSKGFLIRDLYNNELLGGEGVLYWDGQDNDGSIGNIGIYVIYADIFHPDGDRMTFKKSVVLADFLGK